MPAVHLPQLAGQRHLHLGKVARKAAFDESQGAQLLALAQVGGHAGFAAGGQYLPELAHAGHMGVHDARKLLPAVHHHALVAGLGRGHQVAPVLALVEQLGTIACGQHPAHLPKIARLALPDGVGCFARQLGQVVRPHAVGQCLPGSLHSLRHPFGVKVRRHLRRGGLEAVGNAALLGVGVLRSSLAVEMAQVGGIRHRKLHRAALLFDASNGHAGQPRQDERARPKVARAPRLGNKALHRAEGELKGLRCFNHGAALSGVFCWQSRRGSG